MPLTEHKTKSQHYYTDESGRYQGEFKTWYKNGQLRGHCFFKDGNFHGECKWWHSNGQLEYHCFYIDDRWHGECKRWHSDGKLALHSFDIEGKEVVDFLENPELYPTTPEAKVFFALMYGAGELIPLTAT